MLVIIEINPEIVSDNYVKQTPESLQFHIHHHNHYTNKERSYVLIANSSVLDKKKKKKKKKRNIETVVGCRQVFSFDVTIYEVKNFFIILVKH